eukprot:scaffold20.g7857.t1
MSGSTRIVKKQLQALRTSGVDKAAAPPSQSKARRRTKKAKPVADPQEVKEANLQYFIKTKSAGGQSQELLAQVLSKRGFTQHPAQQQQQQQAGEEEEDDLLEFADLMAARRAPGWARAPPAGAAAAATGGGSQQQQQQPTFAEVMASVWQALEAAATQQGGGGPRGAHLSVQGLCYQPPGAPAPLLSGVHMELPPNQLGLVFGRSGSGKTTLLQLLAGLAEPTAGAISFSGPPAGASSGAGAASGAASGGVPAAARMAHAGLVFQFPERHFLGGTLAQELTAGWPALPEGLAQRQTLVARTHAEAGLAHLPLDTPLSSLSDGYKRRVALAVQLVRRPALLVLDEPLAGLDWRARAELLQVLRPLKRECSVVVVSHDLRELAPLVDVAWEMEAGGRLTRDLPRTLTIKTDKKRLGGLKKSKSSIDLHRPAASPPQPAPPNPFAASSQHATAPSSPQDSGSSSGRAGPVQIPLQLSRARTAPLELELDASAFSAFSQVLSSTPAGASAASSLASHRGGPAPGADSPAHRAGSLSKELFEAHGDVVTAQAQAQRLQAALRKEHEEVARLRQALELMTAERDRLLHELAGGQASAAVFDLEDSVAASSRSLAARGSAPAPTPRRAGGRLADCDYDGDCDFGPQLVPLPTAAPGAEASTPTVTPRRAAAGARPSALRLR